MRLLGDIEDRYLGQFLAGGAEGVGYQLKDRLADVEPLTEAVEGVPAARRDRSTP